MAACELPVHLINDFKGAQAFDKVAVLARRVSQATFANKTSRPVIPLRGADLNDRQSIVDRLKANNLEGVTHVFWFVDANRPPKVGNAVVLRYILKATEYLQPITTTFLGHSPQFVQDRMYGIVAYFSGSASNQQNLSWMGNVLGALESLNAPLENFTLGTGGKQYGMHLGPHVWSGYSTPFDEDKTKCPGPLSYFDMQDYLEQQARVLDFRWNVVRPTYIIGCCPEMTNTTQSFGLVFGVYASILKHQGLPLVYPGTPGNWYAKIQVSTSKKIAHVAAWAATASSAGLSSVYNRHFEDPDVETIQNQAFNVVSCHAFSWSEIWEDLAKYFGMKSGGAPRSVTGQPCLDVLGGEDTAEVLWNGLIQKHNLEQLAFQKVFNADFLDKSFSAGWDSQFAVDKLGRSGYPSDIIVESDAAAILIEFLDRLVADRVLPSFA